MLILIRVSQIIISVSFSFVCFPLAFHLRSLKKNKKEVNGQNLDTASVFARAGPTLLYSQCFVLL